MRKTNPKSTVLCFKSGRMIIIGSSSELEAEEASQKANRAIEKALNVTMGVKSFRITNIVANADVGFKLQIAKLCE